MEGSKYAQIILKVEELNYLDLCILFNNIYILLLNNSELPTIGTLRYFPKKFGKLITVSSNSKSSVPEALMMRFSLENPYQSWIFRDILLTLLMKLSMWLFWALSMETFPMYCSDLQPTREPCLKSFQLELPRHTEETQLQTSVQTESMASLFFSLVLLPRYSLPVRLTFLTNM